MTIPSPMSLITFASRIAEARPAIAVMRVRRTALICAAAIGQIEVRHVTANEEPLSAVAEKQAAYRT